jgi:hypothetical protein
MMEAQQSPQEEQLPSCHSLLAQRKLYLVNNENMSLFL